MAERPKKKVVNLSGSTELAELPDGSVKATFTPLGVKATGADEQDVKRKLFEAIQEECERSDESAQKFQEWIPQNVAVIEMTDEEIRAEENMKAEAKEASSGFAELTEATLDEAIGASTPVLVDFWAQWCKPCLMAAPIVKEISDESVGRFTVAKVNVDENQDLSDRFGVQGIPCFIMFAGGRELGRIVGAMPKEEFRKEIEGILG